jgi:hypothetical protein
LIDAGAPLTGHAGFVGLKAHVVITTDVAAVWSIGTYLAARTILSFKENLMTASQSLFVLFGAALLLAPGGYAPQHSNVTASRT